MTINDLPSLTATKLLPLRTRLRSTRLGNRLIRLPCLIAVLLLSACSGHPGTGLWQSNDNNAQGYWQIEVLFDGTAKVHAKGTSAPLMGCFWQANSAEALNLQCGAADNQETKQHFVLQISTADQAMFIKDGQTLARFQRQP